jgi:diguanylate cyclase (GGDEF)-like protein
MESFSSADTDIGSLRDQLAALWLKRREELTPLLEKSMSEEEVLSILIKVINFCQSVEEMEIAYRLPDVINTLIEAKNSLSLLLDRCRGGADEVVNTVHATIGKLDSCFDVTREGITQSNLPTSDFELKLSHPDYQIISVLDRDPSTVSDLTKSLGQIRHRVISWDGSQDPIEFLQNSAPNVILMETQLGGWSGFEVCRKLKNDPDLSNVPVLFMSTKSEIHDRVEGVRAGGDAFFTKPLSSESFIESMQIMSNTPLDVPIRVLSVEDDPHQVQFIQFVLEDAGYLVEPCSNPQNLLHLLESFNPDVLLLDVNLPNFNGFELSRIIRQDARYQTLPIIFLTSMDHDSSYIEGLQAGSDDYLVKPVDPQILLNCVRSRSKRSLVMRTFTDQDGLTRLLNRTSLMRQVDGFFSRANRYGEIVSIAMIDIDNFKETNDTHGHQAGDWVLRDLAQFLQEQLRDSDVIGRYGGEEFAILLPRLKAEEAHFVIDRLRLDYKERGTTLPNGTSISISFSGGVASYPEHGLVRDEIIGAADAALYKSKHSGRNQIFIANFTQAC